MKNDIGYFYDVVPVLDLEHFIELLLVILAKKNQSIYFYKPSNLLTATLSTNYKEVIETIMYEENGWGMKFAKLIDITRYYFEQSEWELDLSQAFKKYIKERNKKLNYDFEFDYLEFEYAKEEIERVLVNYDEEIIEVMSHFANLVKDFGANRRYDLQKIQMDRKIRKRTIKIS